jgi:glycosyltransferase involved in cell wall biosynthesis
MTKSKRKLIFCWPYVEWGGAQIYFMAIMKAAKADWDVVSIFPEGSPDDVRRFLDEIGVRYETLDFRLDLSPTRNGVAAKVGRHLNRFRIELGLLKHLKRYDLADSILHIETSPWQSWIFLTLLRLRDANVFVTMHNGISGPQWRELIWKLRMRFVTRLRGFNLFVSNQDTKNRVRAWARLSYWDQIPVTYTCVDPIQIDAVSKVQLHRDGRRNEYEIAPTDILVLCVGQFIDRKGRWVFLDAAKMLEQTMPNVKFIWVAPQPVSPTDQAKIDALGVNNFRLLVSADVGSTRKEVLKFFRLADVFALASYVEGLPIALLEAMALGVPSISTNVYGIPEAVFHERTGLLVEPGNAVALAEAVRTLASDAELRERIGEDGREFVLANFDERRAAEIAIEAYNRCFAHAPASAK